MNPTLSDLEALARGAGEILLAGFGKDHEVKYKSLIDPVTEVDARSEAYLLQEIRRRFPTHRVVTEESGVHSGDGSFVWFIDPLDGTVNYAHSIPIFAVSVAFAKNGTIRLGVVYDPMRDELFSAERGRGAWLNGARLHVSAAGNLDECLMVTGFPYDIRVNPRNNLDNYARFSLRTQGVRRLGSAALDLCYLAAGRFDGYWELYLERWDVAAGGLIAEEAGARVTTTEGEADYLSPQPSIVAANPAIHAQMLQLLNGPAE